MSERGQFRGGRGGGRGGRGGGGGGDRGGRGGAQSGGQQQQQERPKKENILNLDKYMDKEIMVKFSGGREGMLQYHAVSCCLAAAQTWLRQALTMTVTGILKGHDQLMNLVLDNVKEITRGKLSLVDAIATCALLTLRQTRRETHRQGH